MRNRLRQLWDILNLRQKKILYFLIVINIFNSLLEVGGLGVLFPIIFSLLDPDAINNIPIIKNFLENYAPVRGRNFIILSLFITVVIFILKNVISGWCLWLRIYYSEKIAKEITEQLYKKYMTSSYRRHSQKNTSEIIRNLTQCVLDFKQYFLNKLLETLAYLSIGITYFIFLSFIAPILMMYFCIIMGFTLFVIIRKTKKIAKNLGNQKIAAEKEKNKFILQGISGFKEIKIWIKEFFFIKKFNTNQENLQKISSKANFFIEMPRIIIETIVVFLSITAILILFIQDQGSQLIIAKLGVFAFAAIKVIPMFNFLSSVSTQMGMGGVYLEVIHKELKNQDDDSLIQSRLPTPFKKTIELKNLYFNFNNHKHIKPVLKGINLTIKKNSIIGLVGSSGSGKTTLVDIITGLLQPSSGEILIDKNLLTHPGVWSDRIGYISQQIYLSNASIKENIGFGISEDEIDNKRVLQVLKTAQLADTVKELAQGIDTEIGESGAKLSGGQRQRVGIARALYHRPELLILDEATSALDNQTESEFVTELRKLDIQTTQIIIAHRLTTVKHCDIIYVLDNGKIVEQGTYTQLERKGRHFRKMLLKSTKRTAQKSQLPKLTNSARKNKKYS